jgi:hypothetical protein
LRTVLALLNREQQISLFDLCPVGEVNLLQVAFDPGNQFDGIEGRGIARKVQVLSDFAHDRPGYAHHWRWIRRRGACRTAPGVTLGYDDALEASLRYIE